MRILMILASIVLVACSSAPELATLSGTVSYRERIALLPGTQLVVTLEDTSRADAPAAVLAEFHESVSTQVPLPFTLAYSPADVQSGHRYSVRAKLVDAEGRLLFTSDTHIPVLAANDPRNNIHIPLVAAQHATPNENRPGRSFLFECADGDFLVRTGPGELALWLGDDYRVLSHVPSASGNKYQEGDITVWMKGEEALIDSPDLVGRNCHNNPQRALWEDAKRRGIVFRGSGNEPGWVLELQPEHLTLRLQDGSTRSAPLPEAQHAGRITRYVTSSQAGTLNVELENTRCNDSMADIVYGTRVTIMIGDRMLQGCGNWLQ